MGIIRLLEDFNPWNTKPEAVAPANPKINLKPDLDDEEIEITWKSPSYQGEWCLAGPHRAKNEAAAISREMKAAETGSQPIVERLPPLDTFIATYAQKLNPHSWTIDFYPEDLDWSTQPPNKVNEDAASVKMPKFLEGTNAKAVGPNKMRPYLDQDPNAIVYWVEAKVPNGANPKITLQFGMKGKSFRLVGGTKGKEFLGTWKEDPNGKFNVGDLELKGVTVVITDAFNEIQFY